MYNTRAITPPPPPSSSPPRRGSHKRENKSVNIKSTGTICNMSYIQGLLRRGVRGCLQCLPTPGLGGLLPPGDINDTLTQVIVFTLRTPLLDGLWSLSQAEVSRLRGSPDRRGFGLGRFTVETDVMRFLKDKIF